MEDHRCLEHLHHECGFSARYIVRSSHAGENLVAITYRRRLRRHIAADLGHQHDECSLAEECGFTGHVRTRQDDYLLLLIIKVDIIRYKFLSCRHHCFYDRVTSLLYVDDLTVVDLRTAVPVGDGKVCKSRKHIKTCEYAAVLLNHRYFRLYSRNQSSIYL